MSTNPPTIEVDDLDSAYGDTASLAGSTESLHSAVFKYRRENDRTYHALKDGDYIMPNDEQERDRLDLQHHVFMLINNGKLFTAPVKNPARVLDIGTGTGIWAMDFADQYPASHVIGNDLSPIQPGSIPPNVQFEVDDVSSPWLHKPFNFIHARMLGGSLLSYKDMLASAHQNLAPGGWVECVKLETRTRSLHEDPDELMDSETYSLDIAPYFKQLQDACNGAGDKIERKMNVAPYLKGWLSELGYENVVEKLTMISDTSTTYLLF